MELWSAVTGAISRLFGTERRETPLFASVESPAFPDYAPTNALSAIARFVAVWQCCEILSSDIAGRPLRALRKTGRRAKATEVDDPALMLLEERPNVGWSAFEFRQLLVIDWLLPGNAYVWMPGGPGAPAIYRLHPSEVEPIAAPLGITTGYRWRESISGQERILPPEEVVHIRGMSWQTGAKAVLGESAVRALHDDLTTDLGARKTAKEAASRGRPDLLFSLDQALGPGIGRELVTAWKEAMARRDGAFVLGQGAKATQLSWSPKDMLNPERVKQLQADIFATFGVPLSRAGIEGAANYATARQTEKTYWERLIARVRVFEDGFSRLAQPGVRIVHDFDAVEALQVSRTEKLTRVEVLVRLGASPKDAMAYEGFEDAPVGDEPRQAAAPADKQPPASADDTSNDDEPAEPTDKALRESLERARQSVTRAHAEGLLGHEALTDWHTRTLAAELRDLGIDDPAAVAADLIATLRIAAEMGARFDVGTLANDLHHQHRRSA